MADLKELQSKQEELQAHQKSTTERLDELQAEIDAKIAEEKKPELRHGDWWVRPDGKINIYLKRFDSPSKIGETKEMVALDDYAICNIGCTYNGELIQGNIFDDIKAMQENVTEFEVNCGTSPEDFMRLSIYNKEVLVRCCQNDDEACVYLPLSKFEEYTKNCQKVLATLKRNSKGK